MLREDAKSEPWRNAPRSQRWLSGATAGVPRLRTPRAIKQRMHDDALRHTVREAQPLMPFRPPAARSARGGRSTRERRLKTRRRVPVPPHVVHASRTERYPSALRQRESACEVVVFFSRAAPPSCLPPARRRRQEEVRAAQGFTDSCPACRTWQQRERRVMQPTFAGELRRRDEKDEDRWRYEKQKDNDEGPPRPAFTPTAQPRNEKRRCRVTRCLPFA